jgi:hypothetical protein
MTAMCLYVVTLPYGIEWVISYTLEVNTAMLFPPCSSASFVVCLDMAVCGPTRKVESRPSQVESDDVEGVGRSGKRLLMYDYDADFRDYVCRLDSIQQR